MAFVSPLGRLATGVTQLIDESGTDVLAIKDIDRSVTNVMNIGITNATTITLGRLDQTVNVNSSLVLDRTDSDTVLIAPESGPFPAGLAKGCLRVTAGGAFEWYTGAAWQSATDATYWSRFGTIVFPATPGDTINVTNATDDIKLTTNGANIQIGATNSDALNIYAGANLGGVIGLLVDDGLTIALEGTDGKANHNLIITSYSNLGDDYDHSTASINPTLIVHSATAAGSATDEWVSMTHDQTDGLITSGAGSLNFADTYLSAAIPISQSGTTGLSGFTAISIVAALNELKAGGGGTLDDAYDFGGAGSGRTITADSGAVVIDATGADALEIHGNITLADQDDLIYYNAANYGAIELGNSNQATSKGMMFLTGSSDGNYVLICEHADRAVDFGIAVQTNPTLFVHSGDATTVADYVSFSHDQTDGVIDTGTGMLRLKPVTCVAIGTGTPGVASGAGDLYVTDQFEVDAGFYAHGFSQFSSYAMFNGPIYCTSEFHIGQNKAILTWNTWQTNDGPTLGLKDSNYFLIGLDANLDGSGEDYVFGNQTDPTLVIFSATASGSATDEWVSLTHNQTDAVFAVGSGALFFNAGVKLVTSVVSASTYNLLVGDYILLVAYSTTGVCTVTLPTAQALDGRVICVKDSGYNSGTYNITIATGGAETINNGSDYTIDVNGGSVWLTSDGTDWHILASY